MGVLGRNLKFCIPENSKKSSSTCISPFCVKQGVMGICNYFDFTPSLDCTVGGHKCVNSVIQDNTVLGKSIEN